jgi:hypothetical protein
MAVLRADFVNYVRRHRVILINRRYKQHLVKKVFPWFIVLFIVIFNEAPAQRSSLKFAAEFPLHFGIGYEGLIGRGVSAGGSMGVMTSPNSDLIISYLRFIGTDEELVLIVEDAFQLGIVGEINLNYNFKRNYIGIFSQVIGAQGGDVSAELLEDYFDVELDDYPVKPGGSTAQERNLKLRTRLYQLGLLYGHRFPLKDNRFEIDVEVGLSANLGSVSKLYSDNRDLSELNERLNFELKTFYQEYAFIPSVGVMFVYKFARGRD